MAPAVIVRLRRVSGPGRGELWTLELTAGQALLRDEAGKLRNVFACADAAREWVMPSFVDGNHLEIPADEGPVAFDCRRSGLRHVRAFVRAGVGDADPKGVRSAWRRAIGELILGAVLLAGGAGGTLASFAASVTTGGMTIYHGVVLVGLIELGRGAFLLRECVLVRRERRPHSFALTSPPPVPERTPAAVMTDAPPPRAGRRPVQVFILVAGGFLALSFAVAIIVVGAASWLKPAPGRTPVVSSAGSSPNTPPAAPASSRPGVPEPGGTTNDEPPVGAEPETPRSPVPEAPVEVAPGTNVIVVAGAVEITDPPSSVRAGALVSNERAQVFLEVEDRLLTEPVACDAMTPATLTAAASGAPGTIESGARVTSYLLHANTVGGEVADFEGEITFPADIIGLIVNHGTLDASDVPLGREGVAYPTGGRWRGWLDGDSTDWVTISPDRRTLSFRSSTGRWVDQIRVVVRGR